LNALPYLALCGRLRQHGRTRGIPSSPGRTQASFRLPHREHDHDVDFNVVRPRYFGLLGIPIVKGRTFTADGLADRFPSCGDAKMELFDYIEVFYNQRRRHSTLGYISPALFERRTAMDAAVPVDAQIAPTGTWEAASSAVSHSAHSPSSFTWKDTLANGNRLN
jgi:hypothetical protein